MLSTERPSTLRLWGFVCTALGGLLIALGSLLTWATAALGPKIPGVDTKGVDTPEGKVVLALGVAILLAIVALRLSTSPNVRRAIAVGVIVASLAAGALTLWDLIAKEHRLGLPAASKEAALIAGQTDLPENVLRAKLERLTFVSLKPGIYLPLAGAALGVLGGALGLAWVGRETARPRAGGVRGDPAGPGDRVDEPGSRPEGTTDVPGVRPEPSEPSAAFPLPPNPD
jgi:hypothetical protein